MSKLSISNINVRYFELVVKENLVNGFIQKVQRIDSKDYFLKFKINTKEKNETLCVGNGILVISNYNPKVKEQNRGFSQRLNKLLDNRRILDVKQINYEKIIEFDFHEYFLIFELFSNNNMILTDKDYKIVDCLYKEEWKDRILKPNHIYTVPKSVAENPLDYKFNEKNFDLKENMVINIIKKINTAPVIIEDIIKKLKIDKINYTAKELEKVFKEIRKLYESKDLKDNSYVYTNPVIDEKYIKEMLMKEELSLTKKKDKEVNRLDKMLRIQEKRSEQLKLQVIDYKIKGDLVYQYYNEIDNIVDKVNKAKEAGKSFKEIEDILLENKTKFKELENFKGIDKKNKKILFNLPLQQQVVSRQQ